MELFWEPQTITKIIDEKYGDGRSEMSSWQQGFLCGLIKEYDPKKIVEIGVSAGGTTAVVLNALSMLCSDAHMYSVDYNENYYLDRSKKTGFIAEWASEYLKKADTNSRWKHELLTGGGICNFLDKIGNKIDFLILDTVHSCPGEILDFLVCLPYLTDDAVVVMHDIAMQFTSYRNAYATQLLLDTVSAKKIVLRDENDEYHGYPNIGAFQICDDTLRYIDNVFSALNISWNYIPSELELYRDELSKNYDEKLMDIFECAVINNTESLNKYVDKKDNELIEIAKLVHLIAGRNIYIYGNGNVGKRLHVILEKAGINILGHIVSTIEKPEDSVICIDDVILNKDDVVVVGVGSNLKPIIEEQLKIRGIEEYISV
ncbi:class I SAM-dependent methyltransferase [Butyrivibrio hungatei]|uniref:Methyltransferase domain-containing protein n=1 Tax=Butyrivibrio hungatei TaxID=185008 RepID=A0A1D9P4P5_9FIRM|nr:class I SAM-dependent methyltransferase [Butyrivibrio hungatei]AOZ97314.1 hypothetical protein bhn_I2281 [Butyrivibrio hungatei]